MFGRLGWAEILIIVVLIMILFGHNKIPSMMKNLAGGLKTFKHEMKEETPAASASTKKVAAKKVAAKKAPGKKQAKK